ncbi:uncharacterized protein LOC110229152 [Arabidopsis lyrata subsp. lyrata]|uniref:uncharacterized protein LOC110229152 n=1 Tax=Arabidopsis lyrata subsp. lyrata TaxID=81972 RepID=UPI000A29C006|nr:uncharacterized protein LOC110229152 [Arabidopsis lyrata subsp. lyrata]|eukprot:XP_020884094.1 uncharacterized protein LOC110229152 [Arabidopsis lyrata subsp. lyrata]
MTFGDLIRLRSRNQHFVMPKAKREELAGAYTCVYWNIDDYPIPDDIKHDLIYSNIKSALEKMGYRCSDLEIFAYGEKIKEATELNELFDAGIKYSNHKVPYIEMLRDIVGSNHKSSSNLMVISKSHPQDTESRRVLRALNSRGSHVLLVQPQPESQASEQLFHRPDLLCCSTYLLDGRKAMDHKRGTPSPQVFTSPLCRSNKQDFSEPTTPVIGGAKTGVFWDVP